MPLEVIGVGVGRTGTYSLKLALERLGYGPTHHMEEVMKNVARNAPLWERAAHGDADWEALYKGYNSAVDWPTASFWRELSEVYPEARFILTSRSAESWYESFSQTIFKLMQVTDHSPRQAEPFLMMARAVLGKAGFFGPTSREDLIAAYEAHARAITEELPPSRLLVFDCKEGWEPLCSFLGHDVPEEPFPQSNSRKDFWVRILKKPKQ